MLKHTKIISAFPGTGKTWVYANQGREQLVLDSDSSNFSWSAPGVRNPAFPANYVKHILDKVGQADIIFVSSHKAVRDALFAAGVMFTLVYPEMDLRDEYIERYRARGSSEEFIKMLGGNWTGFIQELEDQEGCDHLVLASGEFLADALAANKVLV